jgi:phosphatidylserine synthase
VFRVNAYAAAILLRSVPGLASLVLSWSGHGMSAGCALVLAVWCDVIVGWLARRHAWNKQATHVQLEGFVDCVCFVWAPVQFLVALYCDAALLVAAPVFALAGLFRLARFNVEGLANGGYRGLPVTYNGYLIPLTALGAHYLAAPYASLLCAGMLLVLSALMVSRRLVVPEF